MRIVFLLAAAMLAVPLVSAAAEGGREAALQRLLELHAMVLDPEARFSASATFEELERLEQEIASAPPDARERGELWYVRAIVASKVNVPESAVVFGEIALDVDAARPFLTEGERVRFVSLVAGQAADAGECATAIPLYERGIALMAEDSSFDENQRLGTLEGLGYCLHEEKRFIDARRVNEDVLSGGEALLGPDSPKFLSVLINLAQNVYELGDMARARGHLERALAIATASDDAERADMALFQLGVLAFETGTPDEAETWMQERLARAKASGDAGMIAEAQEDLDILHQKMGR